MFSLFGFDDLIKMFYCVLYDGPTRDPGVNCSLRNERSQVNVFLPVKDFIISKPKYLLRNNNINNIKVNTDMKR